MLMVAVFVVFVKVLKGFLVAMTRLVVSCVVN
jgi:hypothetical protein